jgi:hypothetical protein
MQAALEIRAQEPGRSGLGAGGAAPERGSDGPMLRRGGAFRLSATEALTERCGFKTDTLCQNRAAVPRCRSSAWAAAARSTGQFPRVNSSDYGSEIPSPAVQLPL